MVKGSIATVRSFSRAVTLRVGTFTDRFLGRDRPLGEARLIFEVGSDGASVRELRTRLDLDSGYLSRLLRSLERQGLVELNPSPMDRRIRHVRLTAAGASELATLDQRGDEFASSILARLDEAEQVRIVRAMDEVERLLSLSFTHLTLEDPASHDARWCVEQYFAELGQRFERGFDASKSLPAADDDLRPPQGALLIARLDGSAVGCGAVKTAAPGVGSIKRMWVSPTVRGIGIGWRLLQALEAEAHALGLGVLRLETNRQLPEARALYLRNGYRQVEAFNDEPHADSWFEKPNLDPAPSRRAR